MKETSLRAEASFDGSARMTDVGCGLSRRSAAKLFSVAPLTAMKRVDQQRRTGSVCPRAQGGDNRLHRLEDYADEILALVKRTKDLTLSQLALHLDESYGLDRVV